MRHKYIYRVTFKIALLFLGFILASPLSSQDPIKIVPLGNSITSARVTTAGANSYRRNLWHKLEDAGYDVDFVGSQDTDHKGGVYPDPSFDHDHEGHWGWRSDQIVADLATWLGGYTPDVALIHLGSNDIIQDNTVASTVDEIEVVIDILRNDNSDITIFLAQILPLPDAGDNANVNLLNSELVDLASTMNQAQSRIIIVDQNSGWNIASDTYDDIHPNTTGEEKMATRWFDAFDDVFFQNAPPEITGQDVLSTNEDTPLELSVSDFVIDDPDTNPSDFVLIVEGGDHYSVFGTTITPSSNWNGTLTVPVRVYDGTSTSKRFDAMVTVDAVDDAPEITGQNALSTDEDTPLELALSDFMIDDPDTDPSNFILSVEDGDHYSVSGTTVTPDLNWNGTLSVPVRVYDGTSNSNPINAIVTVDAVDDAPVITGQNALSTDDETPLELAVSDFMIDDPDTDPLDFVLMVEDGDHYTVSGTTITPDADWNGTLLVPVRVFDGTSNSNRFDAMVTVEAAPFSPEWSPVGAEWYYDLTHAFSGNIDYRRVYCDSTIKVKGIDCQRIIMGGACNIHFSEPIYTYDRNDTIFFFNPDIDSFQVLYNFNAQAGDQWEIYVRDYENIQDTVILQIDSVGTTVINGMTIIRQFVTYKYNYWPGHAYEEKSEIVQKLGDIELVINIVDKYLGVCDADFVHSLRCYEDEELGHYNTGHRESCDYNFVWVNTENSTFESKITVYPNPANDILNVEYFGSINPTYEIFDMNGAMVLTGYEFPIDISELREGFYLLRLKEDGRIKHAKRFIKNH